MKKQDIWWYEIINNISGIACKMRSHDRVSVAASVVAYVGGNGGDRDWFLSTLLCRSRETTQEREENNRMGKTRDLFKKIRDTKGIFHAKIDSVKDKNGMDLTEAEDIKKRWQEYTELYKKRSSWPR